MDLPDIFEKFAGYLDFVLDLVLCQPLTRFAAHGAIHPDAVAYLLSGILMAYVIGPKTGTGGSASNGAQPTAGEAPELLRGRYVLIGILTTLAAGLTFHGFVLLHVRIFGGYAMGSVRETVNAMFLFNSVHVPLEALLKRLDEVSKWFRELGGGWSRLGRTAAIVALIVRLVTLYYVLYVFAAVHVIEVRNVIVPVLAEVVLVVPALLVFFYKLEQRIQYERIKPFLDRFVAALKERREREKRSDG